MLLRDVVSSSAELSACTANAVTTERQGVTVVVAVKGWCVDLA